MRESAKLSKVHNVRASLDEMLRGSVYGGSVWGHGKPLSQASNLCMTNT